MNYTLFHMLHSLAHQSVFSDWLIVFSSNLFGMIMVFIAALFLFFHIDGVFDYKKPFLQLKNKIKEISSVFISGFIAWGMANTIKFFIVSPRPFIILEKIKPLFLHGAMDSFPSGHATFFSALAVSLFLRHKRMGIYYIIVALIVSFARVASGVHFPIDIFAGWILGTIIALIFNRIFRK